MATLSEHVAAVQAAIGEARAEGYLFQVWPDSYNDLESVDLIFVRNKRGEDGVMRVDRKAVIETVYV